jgi:hypothetical protein
MPVQVFVDDSGGKGQSRHFVSCGLVAHSERWARFSNDWRACLERPPFVRTFKMREAANFGGEFYRFSETERNKKVTELAEIIDRHVSFVVFSSIDLPAHADTWGKLPKPLSEPYFWPFHNTINASCFELWDLGWRERFEIVFDEQVIYGPRAVAWYPVVKDLVKQREPEPSILMPVKPMFRSDEECLPIQACDLIAWVQRKDADDPNNRRFAWLDEVITKPYVTDYAQFYDRERLQSFLDEGRRMVRDGEIPIDIFRKHKLRVRPN